MVETLRNQPTLGGRLSSIGGGIPQPTSDVQPSLREGGIPQPTAGEVTRFLVATIAMWQHPDRINYLTRTPEVEAGIKQGELVNSLHWRMGQKWTEEYMVELASSQTQYQENLTPEAMALIRCAAIVQNQIRAEVMETMGVTPQKIKRLNKIKRREIRGQINKQTKDRLDEIDELWRKEHEDKKTKQYTKIPVEDTAENEIKRLLEKGIAELQEKDASGVVPVVPDAK